jgi:prepilin-type N-terminal cleavage/methylation domain-containing protein/prepilin-type processing-associated H-X9-DG protein
MTALHLLEDIRKDHQVSKNYPAPESYRYGFTLVELLVSVAIIGLLTGLLLPAVNQAREATRRLSCQNNLRQLVLSTANFESVHRRFPVGVSHKIELLPFLEQDMLLQQFSSHSNSGNDSLPNILVQGFLCPSDPGQVSSVTHFGGELFGSSYQANAGNGVLGYGFNGLFAYDKGFSNFYPTRDIRVADVTDGLSNTAAYSECLLPRGASSRLSEMWVSPSQYFHERDLHRLAAECDSIPSDPAKFGYQTLGLPRGTPWHGGSMGIAMYTHTLTPNRPSCTNKLEIVTGVYTTSSAHPGGVNVAFADGHIEFISQAVDSNVWVEFGSRESSAQRSL